VRPPSPKLRSMWKPRLTVIIPEPAESFEVGLTSELVEQGVWLIILLTRCVFRSVRYTFLLVSVSFEIRRD
jgi:hypothetical protein